MPFKLKLKKSRQYNVVSKSLFVISIELLDGVVVECTLGSDSTGLECLENVCQRLVINQPEFFGLRYVSRSQQLRWVDLERPLKRQLDKHASSHQLYLRVMYYVISGTSLITDEMTRYHYFLQLKNDLVEGRIVCDCQQAVVLASYSRQAEYGNHDTERHTVDYLKNLLSFPKEMIEGGQIIDASRLTEGGRLERLTALVIQHHQALHNLQQPQAEEGYITACQQLNGYGQETFLARDQSRQNQVTIAISLTGIMVVPENSDTKFYRWTDITNVINHKRTFSVECQNPLDSASFVFGLAEEGKYVWRMCVLQHTFYMKHQQPALLAKQQPHTPDAQHAQPQPNFHNDGLCDSRDDLDLIPPSKLCSGSVGGLLEAQGLLGEEGAQGGLLQQQRALSTSCLDLSGSNQHLHSQNHADKLRALLPSYRAAPDYDTAVQQKYSERIPQAQPYSNHQPHPDPVSLTKPFVYGSQPDIHRPIHYPDVTRHTAAVNLPLRHPYELAGLRHEAYPGLQVNGGLMHQQIQYLNVYKPPPPYPSNGLASNSTPDLALASQSIGAISYHRGYISPHVSGSSPDLVSSRTFLRRQFVNHLNPHVIGYPGIQNVIQSAHGTYENLATVMDVPSGHILIEAPHLSNHIQKVHDDRGNIIYCMPTTQVPYRGHIVLQPKLNPVRDSQEPIYENVPLPWQNAPRPPLRDRAHSLTSAPDVSRLTERKVSQPISIMLNTEQRAQIHTQPQQTKPNFSTVINANQPSNALDTNAQYSPDNLYVNAQIIKTNNNISLPVEEAKVLLNNNALSQSDMKNLSTSLRSLTISKDSNAEVGSNASLKGSLVSLNSTTKTPVIQQSDSNNVTTIMINSSEDSKSNISIGISQGSYTKSVENLHNNSKATKFHSPVAQSGLDISIPSSSFFDSTQQSSAYDFEMSGISSTTSGSMPGKEKKRRRWGGMFGGRSNKTEVKSATLGRDRNKKSQPQDEKHRWSTGLPKTQPLPPSISKETMCQLLERKMADTQLSFAFERIPKGREINTDVSVALNPENSHLNAGNLDYLPYDDNRVRLTPNKYNKHGYINASHITATVGSSQRFYIACSLGPSAGAGGGAGGAPGTGALWQAVWEAGARVLAFLSAKEAVPHLPDKQQTLSVSAHPLQLQVFVESSQSSGYVVTSRVRLTCGKPAGSAGTLPPSRTVWHLQYTEWPDNAQVPTSTQHFLGFLEELSAVRQHCAGEMAPLHNANPPVLVACGQGAGRTGVTVAADLLLYTLEHNQELDIPRVVNLLHQQRANMIQNVHQYRFIHALLIHYLKQTRLI